MVQMSTKKNNNSGKDSLMLACFHGHLDVVQFLCSCGVSWSCCALHWAAAGGHLPVLQYLIQDGCEVAVLNNYEHLVKMLLHRGADSNIHNQAGVNAVQMARAFERRNIISLFVDKK